MFRAASCGAKADPAVVPDLPPRLEIDHGVAMTAEQLGLYRSYSDEIFSMVRAADGIQHRGLVLKLLSGLKQICDHPALFLQQSSPLAHRSGKLDALDDVLGGWCGTGVDAGTGRGRCGRCGAVEGLLVVGRPLRLVGPPASIQATLDPSPHDREDSEADEPGVAAILGSAAESWWLVQQPVAGQWAVVAMAPTKQLAATLEGRAGG
jgi:hypothetical protein